MWSLRAFLCPAWGRTGSGRRPDLLFQSDFLVCNGLLLTLSGSGVSLGLLTADRETLLVAGASVRTHVLLIFDIQLDFAAKISFSQAFGYAIA
jgi:hypothetical protein